MIRKLINDIIHTGDYNNGGINGIYLLDIRDFVSYRFRDDGLYDTCYVEKIKANAGFFELGSVDESTFTESQSNSLYKQELTTFIRTVEGVKSSDILLASVAKYLVIFRNTQGKTYCFGSDGGASLQFTQISGKVGEVTGYQITLSKESMFPLFELDPYGYDYIEVLGTENEEGIITEDDLYTIKI